MAFFQDLIEEYIFPQSEQFDLIAMQLRKGKSPLEIRRLLMQELDLSKLAVGKMVENVVKAIKVAKGNMVSGAFFVVLASVLAYLGGIDITRIILFFIGGAQFIAGWRVWQQYKQAEVVEPAT